MDDAIFDILVKGIITGLLWVFIAWLYPADEKIALGAVIWFYFIGGIVLLGAILHN